MESLGLGRKFPGGWRRLHIERELALSIYWEAGADNNIISKLEIIFLMSLGLPRKVVRDLHSSRIFARRVHLPDRNHAGPWGSAAASRNMRAAALQTIAAAWGWWTQFALVDKLRASSSSGAEERQWKLPRQTRKHQSQAHPCCSLQSSYLCCSGFSSSASARRARCSRVSTL